ncbi:unnamed protein product, partial [Dicrocoelium dendriticum]
MRSRLTRRRCSFALPSARTLRMRLLLLRRLAEREAFSERNHSPTCNVDAIMGDFCVSPPRNLSDADHNRCIRESPDVLSVQSPRTETESDDVQSMSCELGEHDCTAIDLTTSPTPCDEARSFLASWVLNTNTSAWAVNKLLEGLRKFIPSLPKDYRTLMRTPRTTNEMEVHP